MMSEIPHVGTALGWRDRLGAWMVRWRFRRMHYRVEPGLYAVGRPTADSLVLVSANYKLSFDRLRSQLAGLDAWLLVLDTRGINVWCSAGKGTFCAEEIARRIEATRLDQVVSHRTLVVPQLAAPGVAAHEVRRQTGFSVVYGPVRAEDIPAFLAAGMQAEPEMRRVRFPLSDRLAVVPVELVAALKYVLLVGAAFLLLAGLGRDGYSLARVGSVGIWSVLVLLVAAAGGVSLTAAGLPWLPGRALALKGFWIGVLLTLGMFAVTGFSPDWAGGRLSALAWCLIVPAVSSFMAMSYSGATTYTSLSGVRREMRLALPVQIAAGLAGAIVWLVGRFC